MNFETNRLDTFNSWPSSAPVDPIRIAKAGFFYTGEGTEVQCFSCGGRISGWNYGDQVMWRHRLLEPNCPFVVDPQMSGNVPLILDRECPEADASPVTFSGSQSEVDGSQSQDYGLREEDETYRNDALRLVSFVNWDDSSVSREALASAGFYHVGGGRLRCAWCGGELAPFRNFGTLGHPLDVHRIYFPRCAHAASLAESRRAATAFLSSVSTMGHPEPPPYVQLPTTPPTGTPTSQAQSSGAAHNSRVLGNGGTWRLLGVVGAGAGAGARHSALCSRAARLATFQPPMQWPADRTQTPQALADAGFFYTGTDDQVRCFYCDGGLGKWEAGDAPWSEHARWFPHCGYVLLLKGQQFVDACRDQRQPRSASQGSGIGTVTEAQVSECMESEPALAALSAGLDAARVRRAIKRRLRNTGMAFTSSEALIDAVLNDQLAEEPWGESPQATSHRLARDILAHTLRELAPTARITSSSQDSSPERTRSHSTSPERSPARIVIPPQTRNVVRETADVAPQPETTSRTESSENITSNIIESTNAATPEKKALTLEEENRQLKEARLCKVCMDNEVSVVFLPCGHLVSCGGCGSALAACPLCRAAVRALVRAYLA